MPTARCWIGSDQYCQLSKRATKARPRAGPRRKRDSRVISVSALSRKPITATMRRHRSGTSPKKSLRQAVASISPEAQTSRTRRRAYPDRGSKSSLVKPPSLRAGASTKAADIPVATKTEFNGIGGLPIYIRIVPVRGTFRTGERTFQCKKWLPLPPSWAQ